MSLALELAREAYARTEVPVGAVIASATGEIIAGAHNRVEEWGDPTAHAELLAIRDACEKTGAKFLQNYDLYVTLEPCAMCAAALSFVRIRRIYFGAFDPKMGGVEHGARFFTQPTCHHKPEIIGGVNEQECAELLRKFFEGKR